MGNNRYALHKADEFAIWTTPPSPVELHDALEIVKPKLIYLIAINPTEEKVDEFLTHLAGLTKFAIRQRRVRRAPWKQLNCILPMEPI